MSDDQLQALRRLLLEEDRRRIKDLEQTVERLQTQLVEKNVDRDSLIEGLAPVIGDVLQKSMVDQQEDMIAVFAPIIGPAMQRRLKETQGEIIDALYPVIGRAVRKSVAESMKQLIDQVNRRIDATLRSGLFFKRIQAKLTGVSEAELVLKEALPFRIEQIFLIHKDSGLLIAHAFALDQAQTVDQELISGMLTAIKSFIEQAFHSQNEELRQIEYGDNKIILEESGHFYLAFVVTGSPPPDFREKVHRLAERIHVIFHKKLREFNGDAGEFSGARRLLIGSIREFAPKPTEVAVKNTRPYVLYVLLFVGLPLLLFFGGKNLYRHFNDKNIYGTIVARLQGDDFPVSVPEDLDISVQKGVVTLAGNVSSPQVIEALDSVIGQTPNVKGVVNRLAYIRPSEKIMQDIQQRMIRFRNLPELSPKFVIEKDRVFIEGTASNADVRREIGFVVRSVEGVNSVINNMAPADDAFSKAQQRLYAMIIPFAFNEARLTEQQTALLDSIPVLLQPFVDYVLYIRGFSDDLGSAEHNKRLAEKRARIVADYLLAKQITAAHIRVEGLGAGFPISPNDTEENRRRNRRVAFELLRR